MLSSIRFNISGIGRRLAPPLVALALVAAPTVVLASHQFPDVPDEHPFHADIAAIAGAGITAGFGDGTYRPGEPVTRQSMAAFMHRGFGRAALVAGEAPITANVEAAPREASGEVVVVRQLEIQVPGARNGFDPQQMVYLHGRVTFLASMPAGLGCPCEFKVSIREVAGDEPSFEQAQTLLVEYAAYNSIDVEALFAATPGARAYELTAQLVFRDAGVTMAPASFPLSPYSSLSALTFPFPAGD